MKLQRRIFFKVHLCLTYPNGSDFFLSLLLLLKSAGWLLSRIHIATSLNMLCFCCVPLGTIKTVHISTRCQPHCFLIKFIYSEKATKIWRNIQTFDATRRFQIKFGDFVIFQWPTQNIWTLSREWSLRSKVSMYHCIMLPWTP